MKKLILIVVLIAAMSGSCFAIDTTLSAPLTIVNPAAKMNQVSFTIIPGENKIRAMMSFRDSNSQEVQSRECEFVDAAVTNATIAAGKVGQKYIDVMMQAIQTKCKGLWSITGSDN